MSDFGLMQSGAGLAYRGYMAWKFERLLQKAEAQGLTEDELRNSDHRFAAYIRIGRAFETCSSRKVIDYLADAMIGGITSGDIDNKPDYAQIAIAALSSATELELNVLLKMREHKLYEGVDREEFEELKKNFVADCCESLGLEPSLLSAIQNCLTRTGLLTGDQAGWSGRAMNTNQLTALAKLLFRYVDHARRLTQ